jgi:DAK2 domain fusion protein YloV
LDAAALKNGVVASLADLRTARAAIDAANVYPVADSDTGTNLVMTMEAVATALERSGDEPAAIARAVRSGSLVGARGNSGVILAQILRAFADAVEGGPADAEQVARAFKRATELAYDAVLEPAEGTILTVASKAADAAQGPHDDVAEQLVAAARAASDALAHTPDQLKALADAGVVDAGGMGLVVVLAAVARALGGNVEGLQVSSADDDSPPPIRDEASSTFKYEVQYLLDSDATSLEPLRKLLGTIGDSVAVIGGEGMWRVHVHTDDRERAVSLGEAFGTPSSIEVVTFSEQISATNARAQAQAPKDDTVEQPSPGTRGIPLARSERAAALVAVVSGAGVARLFNELGAITVEGAIHGTVPDDALRAAIEEAPANDVFVLPNNDDVYGRVLEMKESLSKNAIVLRTGDVGQGLAAAVAYGDARDTDAAKRDMQEAIDRVRTGIVLIAAADTETPKGPLVRGQVVGLAEGAVVEQGDDPVPVATAVGKALVQDGHDVLTILAGVDASPAEREAVRDALTQAVSTVSIDLHDGGQPVHRYVLAAE